MQSPVVHYMCCVSVSYGRLGSVKHHFHMTREGLMAESENWTSEGLGFHFTACFLRNFGQLIVFYKNIYTLTKIYNFFLKEDLRIKGLFWVTNMLHPSGLLSCGTG